MKMRLKMEATHQIIRMMVSSVLAPTVIAMKIEKQESILKVNIKPESTKTLMIQIHKMTKMEKKTLIL